MELIDVGVDKYAVNIIIDNIIEQVDDQVWSSIILEEIVSFCRDMDVSIPIEEHSYTSTLYRRSEAWTGESRGGGERGGTKSSMGKT